jgi:tRNA (uracil-5-)-methyltransferase TRM9
MGVKATQPEGRTSENDLDDGNGKGAESEERIEEKIQDVLVPWVLRSKPKPKSKSKPKTKSKSNPVSTLDPNSNDFENTSGEPEGGKTANQEKEEDHKEEVEEEEKEEEKVFNRYYHLFVEGELRDLIYKAGEEEGYRILPPISSSPSPSSTPSSLHVSTTTKNDKKEINDGDGPGNGKWLRIRGEGWEADNWWVEAEVGVGDGQ